MNETLTIKPSVKEYIPPFLLLSAFCSLLIFFSILIFEKHVDFILPSITILLIAVIFILAFAPAVLFERLILNQNYLVHKTLLKTETIQVSDIEKVQEEMPYKRGDQLVFVSSRKKIRIIYQTYPEQDIKRFLIKLLDLNPQIKNHFDAIEL